MDSEFNWIKYGVFAIHKHEQKEQSLGEVHICAEPRLIKGELRVIVMPENHSRWLVFPSELKEVRGE